MDVVDVCGLRFNTPWVIHRIGIIIEVLINIKCVFVCVLTVCTFSKRLVVGGSCWEENEYEMSIHLEKRRLILY